MSDLMEKMWESLAEPFGELIFAVSEQTKASMEGAKELAGRVAEGSRVANKQIADTATAIGQVGSEKLSPIADALEYNTVTAVLGHHKPKERRRFIQKARPEQLREVDLTDPEIQELADSMVESRKMEYYAKYRKHTDDWHKKLRELEDSLHGPVWFSEDGSDPDRDFNVRHHHPKGGIPSEERQAAHDEAAGDVLNSLVLWETVQRYPKEFDELSTKAYELSDRLVELRKQYDDQNMFGDDQARFNSLTKEFERTKRELQTMGWKVDELNIDSGRMINTPEFKHEVLRDRTARRRQKRIKRESTL